MLAKLSEIEYSNLWL